MKMNVVLAAALTLFVSTLALAAEPKTPGLLATLDLKGQLDPLSVRATPDGRYVTVPSIVPPAKGGGEPSYFCTLIDTAGGKPVNLGDWLDDSHKKEGWQIAAARPSPDGKSLLAAGHLAGSARMCVFLVDLESHKVRMIDQASISAATWVGARAAIGAVDKKDNVAPLKFYNPATDRWSESKVVALPASADANGSLLAVGASAEGPTAPLAMKDFAKGNTLLIDPSGKVLLNLGTNREVGTPPVLAPGGQFAAFQYNAWKDADPNGPPNVIRLDIVGTSDDVRRSIAEDCIPLAVTDAGEVLAISSEGDADGATLRWFDAAGKGRTLCENAWCALAAGGKIYYIAAKQNEPLTLRYMEQPK